MFVFDFPNATESTGTDLVYEVVRVSSKFSFVLLHHNGSGNRGVFLCSEDGGIKILFHELFGGLHFDGSGVFWCVDGGLDFFGELVGFFDGGKDVFFVHVEIGVELDDVAVNNFLEANGGVGSGDFVDTFTFAGRFLGCSIHFGKYMSKSKIYRNKNLNKSFSLLRLLSI